MSAITGVLNWLKDIGTNLIMMVENFFTSLKAIILNIPKVIEFLTGAMSALPGPLLVFATATVGICVAYLLVGRSTGGSE